MFSNLLNLSKITSSYRSRLIIKAFKDYIKKDKKVLDIGCGTGVATQEISDNFNIKVIGCDVKNYLILDIPFYKIPKNGKLPFKNKAFDLAMINDVLHHVDKDSQVKIVKQALRVAKKVLIFEIEPSLSAKIFDIVLNKLHYSSLDAPLTFRTRNQWRESFHLIGVKYIIKKMKSPFWYPFNHIAMIISKKN